MAESKTQEVQLQIYFRLLRLSKLQMMTLSRQFTDLVVTGDLPCYQVALPWQLERLGDLMMFVVRQQIAVTETDILVTIHANEPMQSIPSSVNHLLKHWDCQLCIQVN